MAYFDKVFRQRIPTKTLRHGLWDKLYLPGQKSFGLVKRGTLAQFPGLDFTRKEMTIVGSRASVNCFPESLQLLASGRIRYPKVATEINMWEAPSAFAKLHENAGAMHKGVLVLTNEK